MVDYNEENRASAVLAKIGNGTADADFARAIEAVLDRVRQTEKRGAVVLTVQVNPRAELGCVELRADIIAKLPKLPAPASQMHLGPKGELMTQLDFLMGGGKSEAPQPISAPSSASGRLIAQAPVAHKPELAPLAHKPQPAPLAPAPEKKD